MLLMSLAHIAAVLMGKICSSPSSFLSHRHVLFHKHWHFRARRQYRLASLDLMQLEVAMFAVQAGVSPLPLFVRLAPSAPNLFKDGHPDTTLCNTPPSQTLRKSFRRCSSCCSLAAGFSKLSLVSLDCGEAPHFCARARKHDSLPQPLLHHELGLTELRNK